MSCLIYGFLLSVCMPITGPWGLGENSALELANQRTLYFGYRVVVARKNMTEVSTFLSTFRVFMMTISNKK